MGRTLEDIEDTDFALLNDIANLQPIVAKRHYHETGAMRWYDVAIAPLEQVKASPENFRPKPGGVGTFVMAVPSANEPVETAQLSAQASLEADPRLGPGCGAVPGGLEFPPPWPGNCWLPSR